MAFSVTPTLGVDLAVNSLNLFDLNHALGQKIVDNEGRDRILARAGAALTAGASIAVNATTFAATADANGLYVVPTGINPADTSYFWARAKVV